MENEKYKLIAIFGKSGSGKDYLLNKLLKNNPGEFHKVVATTTRPPRIGEEDGITYHFVSPEDFAKKILNFSMLEATDFNGWFYGTTIEDLDKDKLNIGIFNPTAIECLLQDNRLIVYPIEIKADDKTRLTRQLNREEDPNCHEICRRFLADEVDYMDIHFKYDSYYNSNLNVSFTSYVSAILEEGEFK